MSQDESKPTHSNSNKDSNEPAEPPHSYDGIVELDNQLPKWWLATLYGAIVFAFIYFFYYVLGEGPSLRSEYEHAHQEAEIAAMVRSSHKTVLTDQDLLSLIRDPAKKVEGRTVFQAKCISCHGAHGEGGIGPNLTDDYWIHGGLPSEIVRTITNGILDKGMPPWGPLLKEGEIVSLLAYVRSIRNSNPSGAKAAQGVLVKISQE